MKEIGGYFELERLISNELYKDLIALNNGRNALLYLLKARNIKKLHIPYYLCSEISDILKKYDYNFEYYNIDPDFMPKFNKSLDDFEYLYIVNYYGQLTNDKVINLVKRYGQIILDNTQAFFQKTVYGVDIIYNCRKFFGVSDGAYLYTNINIRDDLDIDVSKDRMIHLLGRYEGLASEYYDDFKNNDISLKKEPLKYMSNLTHNILGAIDYEKVRQARNRNYEYLENEFISYNKLKLIRPNGAFAYPLYVENGIAARKLLAQKKIYIPTLWPNVINYTLEKCTEYKYAANILPLPCDQRYGINDMKFIVEEMVKCID